MKFRFLSIEQLQKVLSLPKEKRKHLIIQTLTDFKDYGHTVVLGSYEAAADAILYDWQRRTL